MVDPLPVVAGEVGQGDLLDDLRRDLLVRRQRRRFVTGSQPCPDLLGGVLVRDRHEPYRFPGGPLDERSPALAALDRVHRQDQLPRLQPQPAQRDRVGPIAAHPSPARSVAPLELRVAVQSRLQTLPVDDLEMDLRQHQLFTVGVPQFRHDRVEAGRQPSRVEEGGRQLPEGRLGRGRLLAAEVVAPLGELFDHRFADQQRDRDGRQLDLGPARRARPDHPGGDRLPPARRAGHRPLVHRHLRTAQELAQGDRDARSHVDDLVEPHRRLAHPGKPGPLADPQPAG